MTSNWAVFVQDFCETSNAAGYNAVVMGPEIVIPLTLKPAI
jgi:hypothetical protein